MIINCFRIDEALQMLAVSPEEAVQECRKADARLWLDLHDFSPVELEARLDTLGVAGLSRRLCLEARDRPGFYPLNAEIFLVIPVHPGERGTSKQEFVAFLCRENLLLTLHDGSLGILRQVAELEGTDAWLTERSIAGLVSAIMIDLSLDCLRHAGDLRKSVLDLEQRMDREPDTVEAEEILELRSELLVLGSVIADQLPSVQALSAIDKPFFRREASRDYMNCALANLQAAKGSAGWLDGQIGDLRSGFQMHAQDKTNRRLNLLTILSAIFMPSTLLAGIWGMNFEWMPELKVPFAYPIALGLMGLIGSGMYLFFRRTGWFD